ncbi:MAG: hypothetical protein WC822_05800 [Candidatus Paceibacterota bacterium]|jgi:hypothetical protein
MPDKDVLSAIGGASESLLDKAAESIEICHKFMAIVALCALEANARGTNMGGVQVGNLAMTGGTRLVAKVTFSKLILNTSVMPTAPAKSKLVDFLHAEAEGLWLFIQKNPTFITYLEQLVNIIEVYARDKSVPFNEVSFSQGFMDREDNIVLEIEQGA